MVPDTSLSPVAPRGRPALFEVRCVDVHALRCTAVLNGDSPAEAVQLAREHGAREHGFTPSFYSRERLTLIAGAVIRR